MNFVQLMLQRQSSEDALRYLQTRCVIDVFSASLNGWFLNQYIIKLLCTLLFTYIYTYECGG